MPTVDQAVFSIVWSWTYPAVLTEPLGSMVTLNGYRAVAARAAGADPGWQWPWASAPKGHWSMFWATYLGGPERLRAISVDAAWERVVPMRSTDVWTCTGPAGTAVTLEARLFPTAVTVIATVSASGPWPLASFAQAMADLRSARSYAHGPAGTPANRSLDGLAVNLRDAARMALAGGGDPGDTAFGSQAYVSAVLHGQGTPADFAMEVADVKACVAGLAGLGPPGPMDDKNLLAANGSTRRSARIYRIRDGHVIWRPDAIANRPLNDPVNCLQQNHVNGVAQIAGLGGLVGWGAGMVRSNNTIDVRVQPMLQRALRTLSHFSSGNGTYRAEVLKDRVAPMLPDMQAIRGVFGWPDD